ncbi:probable UPF0301 protein SRU_0495 at C-terminar half [Coccomyxa sp. Obi]|nr:probable UPF0301 protein SRU_0495 at C-terminar half [Coccomyxa sp. Obi]
MRSARIFDRHPVLKALLSKYSVPSDLGNLLSSFLCGQNFYLPTPLMPRSLREFTRQTYSYPPFPEATIDTAMAGLRYLNAVLRLAEQHGLYASQQYSAEAHKTTEDYADSELPKDGANSETFPGVQILPNTPEPGALLIAHPLQQGYFNRAVVLVTASHPWRGSTGLCINKPPETKPLLVKDHREHGSQVHGRKSPVELLQAMIERSDTGVEASVEGPLLAITFEVEIDETDGKEEAHTSTEDASSKEARKLYEEVCRLEEEVLRLEKEFNTKATSGGAKQRSAKTAGTRDAMKAKHSGRSESLLSALLSDEQFSKFFSRNKIFYGGPVANGSLHTLHARADLGGVPVIPDRRGGLRFGVSVEQLREQMLKGTVSARELQFFDGECIWAPLQLEMELTGGAWICVKMKEEDLVRLQQDQMRKVLPRRAGKQLWKRLLQSLGGEHSGMSTIPNSLAKEIAMLDLT